MIAAEVWVHVTEFLLPETAGWPRRFLIAHSLSKQLLREVCTLGERTVDG